MIISDRLTCRVQVDVRYAGIPEAIEVVRRKLVREIVRTGQEAGAFIREESVWITQGVNDLAPHLGEQMLALWSPDPAEGVILRGGPHDGIERWQVPREADGRPARYLDTPSAVNSSVLAGAVASYVRTGIDSERDRWVYEYIGSKGGGYG